MTNDEIQSDTKDWTWVLARPCPECGFVASETERDGLGAAFRANAAAFDVALRDPGARRRPVPETWSPTEYACHVRDVHAIFDAITATPVAPKIPATKPTIRNTSA